MIMSSRVGLNLEFRPRLLHRITTQGLWLPALVALFSLEITAYSGESTRKPNILLILADDLGYADLGCQGAPKDIVTPHIDSIAKNGIRFTNAYVTAPFCSPTRAGLMTGRYQARFGHENNPPPGGDQGLPLTEITLANRLKALGYATGIVGKWHLGEEPRFHPQKRGFDSFFGFLEGGHPFFPGDKKKSGPILRGTETVDEQEYLTNAFSREAVAFIDRHKKEPFLLMVTYNAVHSPLQSPEMLPKTPENSRKTYVGMIKAMDEGVGKILAKLREYGLEEETLVVFHSDNGAPPGGVTRSSNLPLRGHKEELWEGGLRIPFLMQWKGRLPTGQTDDRPIISLDLHPTAVAAAGGSIPAEAKLDGVNLLPYLTGKNTASPHQVLFWRRGEQYAVRKGDWKLTFVTESKSPHLANLAKDIGQQEDVAPQHPATARELETLFQRWNAQLPPAKRKKGDKN